MKLKGIWLLLLCVNVACSPTYDHKGKTPLVKVGEEFLYKEDLNAASPAGLSGPDSAVFARHFIEEWVKNALVYEKARKNIPNNDVVDELVENYRKSLLVHAYQQNLVEQKLAENIPDEEVKAYYEANRDLFVAGQPLMKGIFIKVPLNAAEVGKVRRCYTKNSSEDVEFLEKYSFQHAVDYNYVYDRWLPLHDVVAKLPLSVSDAEARLKQEGHIELKDSANYYFLNVDSFLPAGEVEPYEYAYKTAKEMLVNLKRISFIGEVKSSLYNEALKEKRIIYY